MHTTIYDRYNERELAAYREGATEAVRFKARPGEITQTLFTAETATHHLYVGYDDIEFGVFLEVTFKDRFTSAGCVCKVTAGSGNYADVMARALAFLARHPHPRPYCNVDY